MNVALLYYYIIYLDLCAARACQSDRKSKSFFFFFAHYYFIEYNGHISIKQLYAFGPKVLQGLASARINRDKPSARARARACVCVLSIFCCVLEVNFKSRVRGALLALSPGPIGQIRFVQMVHSVIVERAAPVIRFSLALYMYFRVRVRLLYNAAIRIYESHVSYLRARCDASLSLACLWVV